MTYEQDLQRLRKNYRAQNNLDPIPVTVYGFANDGTNRVLVQEFKSGGVLSAPFPVLPPAKLMKLKPGDSVYLENFKGQRRISEADNDTAAARGQNTLSNNIQQNTTPTGIPQSSILTLAVSANGTMTLTIAAWNPIAAGVLYVFPGASQDMTGFLPGAGLMCYAMLAIKNDYATIEVTTSTPRAKTDLPLDVADEQECYDALSAGSLPIMSIKLTGETTAFTSDDLKYPNAVDRRQLLNI